MWIIAGLIGFVAGVICCTLSSSGYKREGMREAADNRLLRQQNRVYYEELLRLKEKCGEL